MTEIINEGWQLQSLRITKKWSNSNEMSQYEGKMQFTNGKSEEISFNIPPEKMSQLLAIISDSVTSSAKELAAGLFQSISKSLPPPPRNMDGHP